MRRRLEMVAAVLVLHSADLTEEAKVIELKEWR
jgi:hypothetical protein